MMNLLDESGRQKLVDLLTSDLAFLLVEVTQSLLHWLGAGSNFQGVLGDFPRYAKHVRRTPRKHVGVCTEKVDENDFLFGVEVGADHQCLVVGAVGVERDHLHAFRWFEANCMTFGLWSFSGQGLEPRGEFSRSLDGFSILDALDVALVRVLVGGADGDDPLGPRHL